MTRAGDVALPALSPPGGHTYSETAAHLHIALERLPDAVYVWDDADPDVTWDDTTPERVWDAPFVGGGFTHATCDFIACFIEAGHPDEDHLFSSGQAVITLANPTGEYSTVDASGRLVYAAPGRRVQLLGEADAQSWWLFNGRVTAWDENTDGTVTITAHDGFAQLAPEVTRDWVPGAHLQNAAQRINGILNMWGYTGPRNLAATDDRLGAPVTDRTPLEEIQVTGLSDGGIVFCDADSRFTYRGRDWPAGRTDQTVVRAFTDNICGGPLVVWDLEVVHDDAALASTVTLENYAEPALVATASTPTALWDIPYTYTHPDPDLWVEQSDGTRLAGDLLKLRSNDSARFRFVLHLLDPNQDLWRSGIDLRLGDLVNVVREYPASGGDVGVLDVDNVVVTVVHEITPESWVTTVETSRVVRYRQPQQWDRATYPWDDPNPSNVWSY